MTRRTDDAATGAAGEYPPARTRFDTGAGGCSPAASGGPRANLKPRLSTFGIAAAVLVATAPASLGRTLEVGPGKQFAVPSAAFAAAGDNDTIHIDAAGDYTNDVALIDRNGLTVIGTGGDGRRAAIHTDGRVYGGKGIWTFAEGKTGLTLRHLEFSGAAAPDGNGAGLRSQGKGLLVYDCRFHDNQDGILGCYGKTKIEASEFDHNGPTGLTHNLYVGDQAGELTFEFNYSHDTAVGHLLKSRAAVNRIRYNRLTDEAGTGSYEIDLPNGGDCQLVGNIIQQSAGSTNGTIVCYGEEGIVSPKSSLTMIANTIVNDRPEGGVFVDALKLPDDFKLVAKNNLFAGPGEAIRMSAGKPVEVGNISVATVEAAGFRNPSKFDYRPNGSSPAIGAAVPLEKSDPVVDREYAHPMLVRTARLPGPQDVGALQHR